MVSSAAAAGGQHRHAQQERVASPVYRQWPTNGVLTAGPAPPTAPQHHNMMQVVGGIGRGHARQAAGSRPGCGSSGSAAPAPAAAAHPRRRCPAPPPRSAPSPAPHCSSRCRSAGQGAGSTHGSTTIAAISPPSRDPHRRWPHNHDVQRLAIALAAMAARRQKYGCSERVREPQRDRLTFFQFPPTRNLRAMASGGGLESRRRESAEPWVFRGSGALK